MALLLQDVGQLEPVHTVVIYYQDMAGFVVGVIHGHFLCLSVLPETLSQ
jgi:hypothetical protein